MLQHHVTDLVRYLRFDATGFAAAPEIEESLASWRFTRCCQVSVCLTAPRQPYRISDNDRLNQIIASETGDTRLHHWGIRYTLSFVVHDPGRTSSPTNRM